MKIRFRFLVLFYLCLASPLICEEESREDKARRRIRAISEAIGTTGATFNSLFPGEGFRDSTYSSAILRTTSMTSLSKILELIESGRLHLPKDIQKEFSLPTNFATSLLETEFKELVEKAKIAKQNADFKFDRAFHRLPLLLRAMNIGRPQLPKYFSPGRIDTEMIEAALSRKTKDSRNSVLEAFESGDFKFPPGFSFETTLPTDALRTYSEEDFSILLSRYEQESTRITVERRQLRQQIMRLAIVFRLNPPSFHQFFDSSSEITRGDYGIATDEEGDLVMLRKIKEAFLKKFEGQERFIDLLKQFFDTPDKKEQTPITEKLRNEYLRCKIPMEQISD